MPTTALTRPSVLLTLLVVVSMLGVGLSNLALAAPGDQPVIQPLPSEEPRVISTIIPGGVVGVPTVTPTPVGVATRPPQDVPTEIPTPRTRPTDVPTPRTQPTNIPTPRTQPTDIPTPQAQPTDIPPTLPTTTLPPLSPLQPGDAPAPTTDLTSLPFGQVGYLDTTTRVCPPEFDGSILDFEQQCTGVLFSGSHRLSLTLPMTGGTSGMEYGGSGVTLQVAAGWKWLSGSVPSAPNGEVNFTHLAVICTLPTQTTDWYPIIAYGPLYAFVKIFPNQTTTCTRYVQLPVTMGTLTVQAWQCPAGFDFTDTTTAASTCTLPVDDIVLVPNPFNTSKAVKYTSWTGDAGTGTAIFTSMIPGAYLVYVGFTPSGTHLDWHVLAACGAYPVSIIDWDFSPGSGWMPNAVVPVGGNGSCDVYAVPPA